MANLKDILFGVTLVAIQGERDKHVTGITFDSRNVSQGDLFIAVKGLTVDGHQYISEAISAGAVAVLCEDLPPDQDPEVTYVQTDNSQKSLGIVATNFYNNPSEKLKLIGITGTNGKTTTATLLHDLFRMLGYKAGLISTVANRIGENSIAADYTTPDAIQINRLLHDMVESGCSHVFMEVSSHALVQNRVAGIKFSGGVFTNITHEHLDYHKTFDEYIRAKKILFDDLPADAFALVNADDRRAGIMLQNSSADKKTLAIKSMANFKAKVLHNTFQGLEMELDGTPVWFKLIGFFNAYNLLTAYAVASLLNEEKDEILTQLSQLEAARGRFEYVENPTNVLAIVDYAHTPDALENVLRTITGLRTGNELVITVVGCGGNRDSEKRPKMARIAIKYSDKIILTSDNPRDEDPEAIIDDMYMGVSKTAEKKTMRIVDRKEAIRTACNLARENDIILVAGKGHENYQEIKGERHHFDDKELLNEILTEA